MRVVAPARISVRLAWLTCGSPARGESHALTLLELPLPTAATAGASRSVLLLRRTAGGRPPSSEKS